MEKGDAYFVKSLRDYMGDGSFAACVQAYSSGENVCNACCMSGAPLLPGELEIYLSFKSLTEWSDLGLEFKRNFVKHCVTLNVNGKKGCIFEKLGVGKTLVCKIFPFVTVGELGTVVLDKTCYLCPAAKNADKEFKKRAKFVREKLVERFGKVLYL